MVQIYALTPGMINVKKCVCRLSVRQQIMRLCIEVETNNKGKQGQNLTYIFNYGRDHGIKIKWYCSMGSDSVYVKLSLEDLIADSRP